MILVIAMAVLFGATPLFAQTPDTLNELGQWLYQQRMTDRDLCVWYQNMEFETAGDSAAVLKIVQAATAYRRGQVKAAAQARSADSLMLTDFCKDELRAIADSIVIVTAVSGANQAEKYRQRAVDKLLPIARQRAADQAITQAITWRRLQNTFIDTTRFNALSAKVDSLGNAHRATADSLNALRDAFNRHVGAYWKDAHPRKGK